MSQSLHILSANHSVTDGIQKYLIKHIHSVLSCDDIFDIIHQICIKIKNLIALKDYLYIHMLLPSGNDVGLPLWMSLRMVPKNKHKNRIKLPRLQKLAVCLCSFHFSEGPASCLQEYFWKLITQNNYEKVIWDQTISKLITQKFVPQKF